MSACIPCLKPFLDAFDSGMLHVAMNKRTGTTRSGSQSNSYALGAMSRNVKESTIRSRYVEDDLEIEGLGTSAAAFAVSAPGRAFDGLGPTMAIQRTDHWSVRHETVDPVTGFVVDETDESAASPSRLGHSM